MYLDKPLAGHNLMQAIARVNRVYGEKPGGLIVDLIGLADPLADALATYANATGETEKPIQELQDEAIPAMQSAVRAAAGVLPRLRLCGGTGSGAANVLRVYLGAIDHVLDVKQASGRRPAGSGFAEWLSGWRRLSRWPCRGKRRGGLAALGVLPARGGDDPQAAGRRGGADRERGVRFESRDIEAAVRQVIGGAVNAGEVIDLFAAAGLDAARLDILCDEFLERVSALQQRNLASKRCGSCSTIRSKSASEPILCRRGGSARRWKRRCSATRTSRLRRPK